jgi:hypothetical protein
VGHRAIFSAVIVPAQLGAHVAVKELKLMSAIFVLGFLAHFIVIRGVEEEKGAAFMDRPRLS